MCLQDLIIRPAAVSDAPALLAIYAPYVLETAVSFEYEAPSPKAFEARIRETLRKYPYLVAEAAGRPVGYAYAGPFHQRAAYDWAVETSIYVAMDQRRLGAGRRLHTALEAALAQMGILNLNACIACPPHAGDPYLTRDSLVFHARLGYRRVGRFRQCGYKFNRWYDMVWMEKHLGPHRASQPPVRPFGTP